MSDNKDYLKSYLRGRKPVYAIFYYVEEGEIKIFSGCKIYPKDEEDARGGDHLCNVFGEPTIPKAEIIEAFELHLKRQSNGESSM